LAYTSRDGRKFTNLSQARAADLRSVPVEGKKIGDGRQPVKSFSQPEAPRQPTAIPPVKTFADSPRHATAIDNSEPQDASSESAVAEHGPAQEVTIRHSGDEHTVTSKHADGYRHQSVHASASEAHDAARTLSGSDEDEHPDDMPGNPMQSVM
jgi:hypothetical protein